MNIFLNLLIFLFLLLINLCGFRFSNNIPQTKPFAYAILVLCLAIALLKSMATFSHTIDYHTICILFGLSISVILTSFLARFRINMFHQNFPLSGSQIKENSLNKFISANRFIANKLMYVLLCIYQAFVVFAMGNIK